MSFRLFFRPRSFGRTYRVDEDGADEVGAVVVLSDARLDEDAIEEDPRPR